MKLNADLEHLHSLLPVEVIVGNEDGHAVLEILVTANSVIHQEYQILLERQSHHSKQPHLS